MSQFIVDVQVQIRPTENNGYGNGLSVNQQITVEASDFMHVAKVLGQFHDLAEELKERGV
jgi:hypothetical protein